MARKLRVEYPGAVYHVMNRGDRREPIFKDDEDRQRFMVTLGEACDKTGWQIHALCLMPNHFHLVLETPQPNLVAGMKWFLGTYTSRFNLVNNSGTRFPETNTIFSRDTFQEIIDFFVLFISSCKIISSSHLCLNQVIAMNS